MPLDTSAVPAQLGNYDVLEKLAEGGMGTVYRGRHRGTGDIVALKVIAPTTAKNPVMLQRFEREFQAARVLDHPNVVRALEYCGTGPHPFLVMELVDGESLGQRLERAGAVPEAEAVRIIAQVCEGLQRAHKQGLVHRDVKPDNIMVTRDGVAKLTDLGLVKDVEGDLNLTKTGRGLGTPHYMAPEQFRNAKGVDIRGDIYSLGATLYAVVTGQVPFENASPLDCWMKKLRNEFPPPRELNPAVSERVDWAIRRAMSAEPNQRPASCREFVEDLTGQSRSSGTTLAPATSASGVDLWYMVYKDEAGQAHTVKGGTDGIRRALIEGLLGDASNILVSRTKTGQFQPLASHPEFRDLVINPAPLPAPGERRVSAGDLFQKASGPVSRAATTRRVADDAVDLGEAPAPGSGKSSMRSGRNPGPPASGTNRSRMPAPYRLAGPDPTPEGEPTAETMPYGAATPPDEPTPPRRPHVPVRPTAPRSPGTDWTPIFVVVLLLLSAALGLYLFKG